MNPLEWLDITGRKRDWVAQQMDISESYLSLLLTGKRRWTEDLQRRFAAAIGVARSAIDYGATECDSESHDVCQRVMLSAPGAEPDEGAK